MIYQLEQDMTVDRERTADGVADATAATAIIAIVVFTMYLWLSGMPT